MTYHKVPTLLYILLLLSITWSCKHKATIHPLNRDATIAVFASGHIEPVDQYNLIANTDGYIINQLVVEGDTVSKDMSMFVLDNLQQQVQVNASLQNLNIAQVNASDKSPVLQQLLAQTRTALIKKRTDSVNAERYMRLYKTNSVSKYDYDNAVLNYQSSLNAYKSLLDNYEATRLQQQQSLVNAQSQYNVNDALNRFYALKAYNKFEVYKIPKRKGELVRKGDILAVLGRRDSMVIKLNVDEDNIGRVLAGQKALIQLNTDKAHTLEAIITKVYPQFDDVSQSFLVDARLTSQQTFKLISGTQLQANIIIAEKKHILMVPKVYVIKNNIVLLKKDKSVDSVKVETGVSDDNYIEIKNGLTTDAALIMPQ